MIGSMPYTEVLDFLRAGFAWVDERFDSIERRMEELASASAGSNARRRL